MTDARFPERWLNDRRLVRLSDAEFRAYVVALVWSVSNRTDGVLDAADLDLVPGARVALASLQAARLWDVQDGTVTITDFASTQTTAAQLAGLERKRVMDRERQARHRGRQRQEPPSPAVTRDTTRDGTRDTEDRTGQDRQGSRDVPLDDVVIEDPPSDWEEHEALAEEDAGWPAPAPLGRGPRRRGWAAA